MTAYNKLFEPIRLGPIEIPNRLVAAFTGIAWGGDNKPSPLATMVAMERAADGIGLIVGEPQSVHTTGTGGAGVVENTDDKIVQACSVISGAVHPHGAKIIGQLWHPGILGNPGFRSVPLWGPSPVRASLGGALPAGGGDIAHEMNLAEIAELVAAFRAAADRLRAAGYDGVEIDAAHGSLLSQFLRTSTNLRNDEYGGSLEKRGRLLTDVLTAVRAAIGEGMALGVRLSPDGFVGGTPEDGKLLDVAHLAVRCGVDYLSVGPAAVPGQSAEEGYFAREVGQLRAGISSIPVLYRGKATIPATAARIVEEGQADLVSVFRATLADPSFVSKTRAGTVQAIRPCTACNEACVGTSAGPTPHCIFRCLPALQTLSTVQQTASPKKVLIVGAGIAGLEAAVMLQERGHKVTLVDRSEDIGGQLRTASRLPAGSVFMQVVDYYLHRISSLGVNLKTGVEMDVDKVVAEQPDIVIVATGSRPVRITLESGMQSYDVTTMVNLDGEVGRRVLVAMGPTERGNQSIPLAESLLKQGHEVALVFSTPALLMEAGHEAQLDTYTRLVSLGAKFHPDSELASYRDGEAEVRNIFSQRVNKVGCDTVVCAYGGIAEDTLFLAVEHAGLSTYQVGDCVAPRDIRAAIRDTQMLVGQLLQQEERKA